MFRLFLHMVCKIVPRNNFREGMYFFFFHMNSVLKGSKNELRLASPSFEPSSMVLLLHSLFFLMVFHFHWWFAVGGNGRIF